MGDDVLMPRQRARVVRTAYKLQAIKLVRALAGVEIKQAKDLVEGQRWFEFELDAQARASIDEHVQEFGSELAYEPDLPDEPDEPDEPGIDPRLLDPRFEVRADLRYLDGPNKLSAIKLARELTGLGLKDTKDLVEQRGWVLRDVPIAETKLAERRFAEVGSRVELVPRSLSIMAFDPRHPARGAQPLVRMRVTGNQLAIEHGHIDAWARTDSQSRSFDTVEQLEAAITAQCRAWTDAGLELEHDAVALLVRASAREPALEQSIREAEDPGEALLVYADWLAAQGDPRGELAPLQQVGATQEFAAALVRHAAHLFGPLQDFVGKLELEWRGGMVSRIAFPPMNLAEVPPSESLRRVFALPIMACLRELKLSGPWSTPDPLSMIGAAVLGGLRVLALENGLHRRVEIASWRALERLERLVIHTGYGHGGPLQLPSLRELCLTARTVDLELVGLFTDAVLDRLDDVELHVTHAPNADTWVEDYTNMMRALLDAMSRQAPLRGRFRLRIDLGTLDGRFVGMLFDAPLAGRVARLELLAALDEQALQTYENRRAKLPRRVEVSLEQPR
jgi:uncharacterized protein (TIGR02996 family)